jgi:hypothetical protein
MMAVNVRYHETIPGWRVEGGASGRRELKEE